MKFITENWFLVIAGIALIAVVIYMIIRFFKLPRPSQIAKIKEWLLYAVALAEKELGSKTGQLKLRYVYDMFVAKFPYVAKLVSFEYFSKLVDEVLVKFKEMFNSNMAIKQFVESNAIEHAEKI